MSTEATNAIPGTQIDGDVAVSRNVTVGGNEQTKGNKYIYGNLTVEGWADLPNIKNDKIVFKEYLKKQLENYFTTDEIDLILRDYITNDELYSSLEDYVTNAALEIRLEEIIDNYLKDASTNIDTSDFAKKSAPNTFTDINEFENEKLKLGGYGLSINSDGAVSASVPTAGGGSNVVWEDESDFYSVLNVDGTPKTVALEGHKHTTDDITGLEDYINTKVSSLYKPMGSCTYAELQNKSRVVGHVWDVTDEVVTSDGKVIPADTNWVWTGTEWDSLGGMIDFSAYLTIEEYINTPHTFLSKKTFGAGLETSQLWLAGYEIKIDTTSAVDGEEPTAVGGIDETELWVNQLGGTVEEKVIGQSHLPGNLIYESDLSKVATSGSYSDLSNKPSIPSYDIATAAAAGLVKSTTTGTAENRDYMVQVNLDGTMKVNVPWVNTWRDVVDGLSSTSTSSSLSANQGRILNNKFTNYVLSAEYESAISSITEGIAALTSSTSLLEGLINTNSTDIHALETIISDLYGNEITKGIIEVNGLKIDRYEIKIDTTSAVDGEEPGVGSLFDEAQMWDILTDGAGNEIIAASHLPHFVTLFGGQHGDISVGAGLAMDAATATVKLSASGATAGSYGPSANVTGNDGNTISIPQIEVDTYGRITGISNKTYTSKNNTYTFNGAVSTIKDSNLTTSRVLISNSNGKVAVSAITSTELGYLDGATSNIQDQFDSIMAIPDSISLIQALADTNAKDIHTLEVDLWDEIDNRLASESILQGNIDSEATARAAADNTLQSNINTEVQARKDAVSNEATLRNNADTILQNNIDSEASARSGSDNTITKVLSEAIAVIKGMVHTNSTNIKGLETQFADLFGECVTKGIIEVNGLKIGEYEIKIDTTDAVPV